MSEDNKHDPFDATTEEPGHDQPFSTELGPVAGPATSERRWQGIHWRVIIWTVLGTLALIMLIAYGQGFFSEIDPDSQVGQNRPPTLTRSAPTPSATSVATPTPGSKSYVFLEPTATPTTQAGGQALILKPESENAGWVVSEEVDLDTVLDSPNHFGDSYLYAGILDGKVYHGAFQFDLGSIPRGNKIIGASLRLPPLRTDLLDGGGGGTWHLRLLGPEVNIGWPNISYDGVHNGPVVHSFEPFTQNQLGEGQFNEVQFGPDQLAYLERRILQGGDQFGPRVAFRVDGPQEGLNNLYAWDSGFGLGSRDRGPELFINLGPAPSATPAPEYVIVTSTPTPDNVMTAAAFSLKMTAEATRVGTATPVPPHWVTPWLVTATPTPGNEATAQAFFELATAVALTTGEPASGLNIVVVTSTPEPEELAEVGTPTATYVIITSTPTPDNVMTAAADSLQLTAEASQGILKTPLPGNWVTPVVVTSTPTPVNAATIEYVGAIALTTGTPTPLPANVHTATPTKVFELVDAIIPPSATPLPTPTPDSIPPSLLGKVVFRSDREPTEEDGTGFRTYLFDLETGQLGRLTSDWPYEVAAAQGAWSPDERFRVFTKDATRYPQAEGGKTEFVPELYVYDYLYKVEWQLTKFGAGLAWGGVWSPISNEIAFVSNESKDDEIWVVNHEGDSIRRLTSTNEAYNAREIGKDTFIPEVNHHPSWSPDGEQIIFASNRTGTFQIWIMNKDGSNQRLFMDWNPYNDWDPIWVKSLDPAPPLVK